MQFRIGTSGWHYAHWRERFYPTALPPSRWLEYYAERFDSVEINNSFYRLPSATTLACWRETTPKRFQFSLKASRFITHNKKLNGLESFELFFNRIEAIRAKLGVILFQLPPRWKVNVERLDEFLGGLPRGLKVAFEFRNATWLCDAVYDTLAKHKAAFCVYDIEGFTAPFIVTADFTYVRLHGPELKYAGAYGEARLGRWYEQIMQQSKLKRAYVYFDNDVAGAAIEDALTFQRLCGEQHGKN